MLSCFRFLEAHPLLLATSASSYINHLPIAFGTNSLQSWIMHLFRWSSALHKIFQSKQNQRKIHQSRVALQSYPLQTCYCKLVSNESTRSSWSQCSRPAGCLTCSTLYSVFRKAVIVASDESLINAESWHPRWFNVNQMALASAIKSWNNAQREYNNNCKLGEPNLLPKPLLKVEKTIKIDCLSCQRIHGQIEKQKAWTGQ